jgi:hypothetical protein
MQIYGAENIYYGSGSDVESFRSGSGSHFKKVSGPVPDLILNIYSCSMPIIYTSFK